MTRDDLVEIPENALIEERIAFGLTAQQLAILTTAALLVGLVNLLPLWAPVKLLLVVLLGGPLALAAVLTVRGEPSYRWLLRGFAYWRSPKLWQAVVKNGHEADATPAAIDDREADGVAVENVDAPLVAAAADNADAATRMLAVPAPPPLLEADGFSNPQERAVVDAKPRLRLVTESESRPDADPATDREEQERPPAIPFVLPGVRTICFFSFAGGVGKTTLAVETASLIAATGRYRTANGDVHPVRVLLVDAARLSSAAGLRLGLPAGELADVWRFREWRDPTRVAAAVRRGRLAVDILTLPPHPQLVGAEAPNDETVGDEFGALEADAILDAAHESGYQLVLVDIGTYLEPGHRRLIAAADVVVGVVRPVIESLPDVLRLAEHLRRLGMARKLVLVANEAADDSELRALAREAGTNVLGAVPPSPLFRSAADRHEPAWRLDPRLRDALLPLARATWPLDTLERDTRRPWFGSLVRRALALAARRDG